MTHDRGPHRAARLTLVVPFAGLVLAAGCDKPVPVQPEDPGVAASVAPGEDPSEHPTFIPYDLPPKLTNVPEVLETLRKAYPADLLGQELGGRVELWLYVNEEGVVENSQVKTGSEHESLDEAALEVARAMSFSPAANKGQVTAIWVSQWITFDPKVKDATS